MNDTTFHAEENESPSEAVIRALAVVTDTRMEHVRPLYESVDPDSLDNLFRGRSTWGEVTFEHADCLITAHRGGKIQLEEMDDPVG